MIKIDVKEQNKDTFEIDFKIKTTSKSQAISQMSAVINSLYNADENLFTIALIRSDFGNMISSLGTDELEEV